MAGINIFNTPHQAALLMQQMDQQQPVAYRLFWQQANALSNRVNARPQITVSNQDLVQDMTNSGARRYGIDSLGKTREYFGIQLNDRIRDFFHNLMEVAAAEVGHPQDIAAAREENLRGVGFAMGIGHRGGCILLCVPNNEQAIFGHEVELLEAFNNLQSPLGQFSIANDFANGESLLWPPPLDHPLRITSIEFWPLTEDQVWGDPAGEAIQGGYTPILLRITNVIKVHELAQLIGIIEENWPGTFYGVKHEYLSQLQYYAGRGRTSPHAHRGCFFPLDEAPWGDA